ncbi:MAG: hypothetical protein ACOCSR_01760 [Wenzhouxiangella sp.]
MKSILPLLIAASLALAGLAPAQDEHDPESRHDHAAGQGELDLKLDDGQRWPSDESLRRGMRTMREAFEDHHRAFEDGALDREGASRLADAVRESVDFMLANCELPPDADAELHKLLAAALGAAASLREDEDVDVGLHRLHEILGTYPEYFDDPGWEE